jgi:hypothetical protein
MLSGVCSPGRSGYFLIEIKGKRNKWEMCSRVVISHMSKKYAMGSIASTKTEVR